MNVSNTGTGSVTGIGVVGNVEETNRSLQGTSGLDLVVEVLDDGDVHSLGAGVNPVDAQLVAVPLVNGLWGGAEVIKDTHEGLEAPPDAALLLPPLAVILEWSERDKSVV